MRTSEHAIKMQNFLFLLVHSIKLKRFYLHGKNVICFESDEMWLFKVKISEMGGRMRRTTI